MRLTVEEAAEMYVEEEYTLEELSQHVGVTAPTLSRKLKERGVEIRPHGIRGRKPAATVPVEVIRGGDSYEPPRRCTCGPRRRVPSGRCYLGCEPCVRCGLDVRGRA